MPVNRGIEDDVIEGTRWKGRKNDSKNWDTESERNKKSLHLLSGSDHSVFVFKYNQLQIVPLLSQTLCCIAFSSINQNRSNKGAKQSYSYSITSLLVSTSICLQNVQGPL